MILEDDAVPAPDFTNQLHYALTYAPSPIVSLYLGKQRPPWAQHGIATAINKATTDNADWIISTRLLHAVGYAIKTDLLPSLLAFTTPAPVDQHITAWATTYGHTVSYTWPSLVDHADLPTVIEQHPDGQPRPPGRTAWTTAPHPTWSTRSVTLTI